jgi:hypothetical protein
MAATDASTPAYSSEDVQAILQTAMSYESDRPFSRSQLKEMAADLNISSEMLAKAEAHWQQATAQRQAAAERQQQRRKHFRQQFGGYIAVNTGLVLLNIATCGTVSWAIYPILGWGIGLCFGPCEGKETRGCRGMGKTWG